MCHKCRTFIVNKLKIQDWNKIAPLLVPDGKRKNELRCICEHPIKTVFLVKYPPTGDIFDLGSKCIENTFEENHDVYKYAMYKTCEVCNRVVKRSSWNSHIKSIKHELNKDILKDKSRCTDCDEFIEKHKYKKTCLSCYNKKRKYSQCKKCKKYLIKPGATFWYCYDCNSKRKKYLK